MKGLTEFSSVTEVLVLVRELRSCRYNLIHHANQGGEIWTRILARCSCSVERVLEDIAGLLSRPTMFLKSLAAGLLLTPGVLGRHST